MKRKLSPEAWTIIIYVIASVLAVLFTEGLTSSGYQGSSSTSESFGYFIVYIVATILITLLILFLARRNKGRSIRYVFLFVMVYVVFFVALVVSDYAYAYLQYYFLYIIYTPFPQLPNMFTVDFYLIWLVPPAFIGYELFTKPNWIVVNITGLIMAIGIASIWSLFLGVWFALALLIILAVYDYISVFKTKHMITLAKVALDESIPMLFVVPESSDFDMSSLSIENRGDNKAVLLGFGDVAIPTVLVVSSTVYGIGRHFSLAFFFLPFVGGIVGMIYLMFFMKRRPAPGLPAINGGVIAGFAVALLLAML
ncbi:MAG: presenilin family intramembrane aspartyl protease [Candidatus Thermoplasmatota archaeon]|nr:presenilin family intramembrane aspartyl protease [Candidatus Thermoplasmatota archaeon]